MSLSIEPVRTRRQRREWLALPWRANAGDPCWVPPLRRDQERRAGFARHPVWDDARREAWLATRDGSPVGRIAAIENPPHNRWHGDRLGFFGFFESIDDERVAAGLLAAAEAWLRERGLTASRGPVSPTVNYEWGLLVDGFDTPPSFLLPHNPRYYEPLLLAAGYRAAHDLYAYEADLAMLDAYLNNRKINNAVAAARERFGVVIRGLDRRRFRLEVDRFLDIYNRSHSDAWGYVPMSRGEVAALAADLRPLIVPELTRIAEVDGRAVGVMLGLLDYNPRVKAIDGRLWPLGFARLLSRKKRLRRLRLVDTSVVPEYQSWGVGVCLARAVLEPALAHGVAECEFSWVLASNHLSRRTIEKGGARRTKTWRVFEKPLG